MDDETILAQASSMIRQQQAVQPVSSSPKSAAKSIAARLENLEAIDDTEARRREAEQLEREKVQEQARRQTRAQSLMAKVGRRYAGCRLDNYAVKHDGQQAVLDGVSVYVRDLEANVDQGRGMLLYGPPGTGKDHLAVAIMLEAIARGSTVEWMDGAEFYGAVRDNIDGDKSEAAFVKRFTSSDLLVLSDPLPPLGAVKSEFQLSMLFRVMDRRYRDQRATILTLNIATRAELEQRLSPNLVDRLAHGAMALHCNWPSYRR